MTSSIPATEASRPAPGGDPGGLGASSSDPAGKRGPGARRKSALYARVWRWHFLAGILVAPFGILLAITGAIYLFKPQIEAAVEHEINANAARGPDLPADRWIEEALRAGGPGTLLQKLVLPYGADDPSVEVQVRAADGSGIQAVWIERASGRVLAQRDPDAEWPALAKKLHGELLQGRTGAYVVELAACWMIVLIVTGLFLAWPRKGVARTLFPRLRLTTRRGWRDLHAAAGLWISGAVLAFLVSGLPWTGVWGQGFNRVAAALGMSGPGQEFRVTLQSSAPPGKAGAGPDGLHPWHSDESVALESSRGAEGTKPVPLQTIVERTASERLVPPVEISAPRGDNGVWTARSMTQYRPDRRTLHYDRWTGEEILRIEFGDRPALQRAVSYGISLHEGALFGPLNQAFGVVVALGVVLLCTSGLVMWWRRRPAGSLGVPPLPADRRIARSLTAAIVVMGCLLPLVGASLMGVALLERLWSGFASLRPGTREHA